jgi:hypothetical protein
MSPTNTRLGLRRTAVELINTQMAYMPTAGPGLADTLVGQRGQILVVVSVVELGHWKTYIREGTSSDSLSLRRQQQ